MPGHLLHGGEVDAEVEQIPVPGPTQVMGSGGLELGLEPALTADPPGAAWAEASQLTRLPKQASRLEHGAEKRAGFRAANLQPVLKSRKSRGWECELPWLAALASTDAQLAADRVEVAQIDRDRLRAAQATAVGEGKEGRVSPAATGGVLTLPLIGRIAAGLEEAAQLAGREMAAAGF